MRCPFCHHSDTRVVDSRDLNEGETVRRRRECRSCGLRFTTYERVELVNLAVVKKDGRREEFDRRKLFGGIRKACEKRPLSMTQLESVVNEIEVALQRLGKSEVHSGIIGEMVMERLRRLDHVAYIRFASVYRPFADLESMRREMENLMRSEVPS